MDSTLRLPVQLALCALLLIWAPSTVSALSCIFPSGAQAGTTVTVELTGGGLDDLYICLPGVTVEKVGDKKFSLTIPADVASGAYDVFALGGGGLTAPLPFTVSRRPESVEIEPNDSLAMPGEPVTLESGGGVINGRLEKPGDFDFHTFTAAKGQVVVVECWAERIDSQLRPQLELYNAAGRRIHPRRHLLGLDPLFAFNVPEDGNYVVKVSDLTYFGGADYVYRLVLDTGPRVLATHPCVLQQGKPGRVTLYGWNLRTPVEPAAAVGARQANLSFEQPATLSLSAPLESIEVVMPSPPSISAIPSIRHLRQRSTQVQVDSFAYRHPESNIPTAICVTDVPVFLDDEENHSSTVAREIEFPCEVSGQLVAAGEEDWFAFAARRGEVLWFEGYGERIESPIDLDLTVLDATGEKELAHFTDELTNHGGIRFPTNHSDPSGRWVAPSDGRYLLLVRNVIGGLSNDPRRVYRVAIRRAEPDFHLVVVSRDGSRAALNVPSHGSHVLEVLALRGRDVTGPIRVTAVDLPSGLECPDVWLSPGVHRAPLVVSSRGHTSTPFVGGPLHLIGHAELSGRQITRPVRGGTTVSPRLPGRRGRVTDEVPIGITTALPLRITARYTQTAHSLGNPIRKWAEPRVSQGSVITLAIDVESIGAGNAKRNGAIRLTGVSLPDSILNEIGEIPAADDRGYISFYLPPTLATGRYTFAIEGQASVAEVGDDGKESTRAFTVYTNPVSFEVYPAPFIVEIAPDAPRKIKRGEVLSIKYVARRKNGFIGKIHTEMEAPGGVVGLRGRGVTFVSQSESSAIQIIANDDAPLGRQRFLRFEGAGYLEDEVIYLGSCFVELEVIDRVKDSP